MVDHVISSMNEVVSYDYTNSHQALDIVGAGHTSSDVIAISDGVVEMVVNNVKYTNHKAKGNATYGNFVKIRHDNGKKSLYAHLKYGSVSVRLGDRISKGEKIGTMGATGNAYGTHLHFEVRSSNEARENPKDYLSGQASLEPTSKEPQVKNPPEEKPQKITEENISNVAKESTNEKVQNVVKEKGPTNEIKESTSNIDNHKVNSKPSNLVLSSSYSGGSIVDGLKSIGIDSSFDHRKVIASENGINNYRGSYDQNVYLLSLLKQGKLKA